MPTAIRNSRASARLLGVALLAIACSSGEPPRAGARREPVRIELAGRLPAADVQASPEHLDFASDGASGLFSAGWYAPEVLEGIRSRWASAPVATLEIPVVSPADLELELSLTPAQQLLRSFLESPAQSIALLWNGAPLAEAGLPIDGDTLRVQVPADRQRSGPNRLELLPSYWLTPNEHRLGGDLPALGVRLDALSVRSAAPQPAPRPPLMRREGDRLVQRAGSVASFGLLLPEGARLRGEVGLGSEPGGSTPGRVEVSLLGASGRSTAAFSRSLEELRSAGSVALDAALDDGGGDAPAMLSLAVSQPAGDSAGDPAPAEILWRNLRIEGSRPAEPPAARLPRGRTNVIVLLLDSLRADHLKPLGDEVETPHARDLARQGVLFENLRTNSSWTRPAVVSMFSGLPPASHGLHSLGDRLDERLPYLPEILQRNGYHTVAVLNSVVVSRAFRTTRGFDKVWTYYEMRPQRRARPDFGPETEAEHVWTSFVEPELRRAGDRPFFVYIHELDPHSPYEPPAATRDLYASGSHARFNNTMHIQAFVRGNPEYLDARAMATLHGLYRGEVAHMDRYLGWMMQRMQETGLTGNTLLVLLSDHGEAFLEHGKLGHGSGVHEEQLRIPLVMALPGVLPAGARSDAAAGIFDVAPTLLDLLGIEAPPAMQGRSLLPYLTAGREGLRDRPLLAHSTDREHDALVLGHWKLVRENPVAAPRRAVTHQLYDLTRDPQESLDRWDQEPVVGPVLRQILDHELQLQAQATGASLEPRTTPLPPAMVEALKALGYGE